MEEGILECSMVELVSSPSSTANESSEAQDEDEVFFGPVKLQEKIAAYHVQTTTQEEEIFAPLNERQWAELHVEAKRVIKRMEKSVLPGEKGHNITPVKLKENILPLNSEAYKKRSERKHSQRNSKYDKENDPNINSLDDSMQTLHTETLHTVCNRSPLIPLQTKTVTDHSPTKRHNRSFTYTVNKSSLELLPGELTESLPHMDSEANNVNNVKSSEDILIDLELDGKNSEERVKNLVNETETNPESCPSEDLSDKLDKESNCNGDTIEKRNANRNDALLIDIESDNQIVQSNADDKGDRMRNDALLIDIESDNQIVQSNVGYKGTVDRKKDLLIDIDCDSETAHSGTSTTNDEQQDVTSRCLDDANKLDEETEDVLMTEKGDSNDTETEVSRGTGTDKNLNTSTIKKSTEMDNNENAYVTTFTQKNDSESSTGIKEDHRAPNEMESSKEEDSKTGALKVEKPKAKSSGLSRLRPPSFRSKDRSTVPALQKLQKPQIQYQTTEEPSKSQTKIQLSSTNQPTTTHPKSRLGVPNQKAPVKKSPVEQNQPAAKPRLSFPKTETSGSLSKLQKPLAAGPVKPSTVKNAGTGAVNPIKAAPASKLQMLKPSGLQRPSVNSKPGDNLKKTGPLKAFKPAIASTTTNHITPAKIEKNVKRTNLAASFTSPKPSRRSSVDSPSESAKKRRSNLPTPNKSRLSAIGSISSPCSTRSSSTSSNKSLPSPLVTGSANKRRTSVARNSDKNGSGLDFNDRSPSSMMSKKPLVVNTPNLPKKKEISPWSPIQKKRPLDQLEEVTRCTKVKK